MCLTFSAESWRQATRTKDLSISCIDITDSIVRDKMIVVLDKQRMSNGRRYPPERINSGRGSTGTRRKIVDFSMTSSRQWSNRLCRSKRVGRNTWTGIWFKLVLGLQRMSFQIIIVRAKRLNSSATCAWSLHARVTWRRLSQSKVHSGCNWGFLTGTCCPVR